MGIWVPWENLPASIEQLIDEEVGTNRVRKGLLRYIVAKAIESSRDDGFTELIKQKDFGESLNLPANTSIIRKEIRFLIANGYIVRVQGYDEFGRNVGNRYRIPTEKYYNRFGHKGQSAWGSVEAIKLFEYLCGMYSLAHSTGGLQLTDRLLAEASSPEWNQQRQYQGFGGEIVDKFLVPVFREVANGVFGLIGENEALAFTSSTIPGILYEEYGKFQSKSRYFYPGSVIRLMFWQEWPQLSYQKQSYRTLEELIARIEFMGPSEYQDWLGRHSRHMTS